MTALILGGVALLTLGAGVCALACPVRWALAVQAAGAALLGVGGGIAAFTGGSCGSEFTSSLSPHVGVDRLSGVLLLLVGAVAAPACLYAAEYVRHLRNPSAVAALGGAFLIALAGVVTARDPTLLLASWELMTLLPALATLVADAGPPTRRAMVDYLALTHIGGAGVWIAVLMLADHGALGGAPLPAHGAAATAVGVAAIVGFGTKAGLVPMHVWLPRAHPVAPSHLSAVMSGAMVAVALYGLMRVTLQWTVPPAWVAPVLVAVGALTALVGILVAATRREMKLLLAHSTVENMGIATAGLGAAVWLTRAGRPAAASLAVAAVLLQLLTHAVAKSALFLGAGAMAEATGTLVLSNMGGLARRMPLTGISTGMAALTLAALPPTAGFASEWAVLQGLVATARVRSPAAAAVAGIALLVLAAAAGLAALTMSKLLGLTLLGAPRHPQHATAAEPRRPLVWAQLALVAAGVALIGTAGAVLPRLARVVPGAPAASDRADLLRVPATGGLAPLGTLALIGVVAVVLMRLRGRPAPTAPIWLCGQPASARSPWSGAAFTTSFRVAVDGVLGTERTTTRDVADGVLQRVHTRGEVPDTIERRVVAPLMRAVGHSAARARRLQSGSLRGYLVWLVALVVGALAMLRLGAL
ncbi:MAG: proton-conducting transporter membrane subunit [Thermoleophilia bacterium]